MAAPFFGCLANAVKGFLSVPLTTPSPHPVQKAQSDHYSKRDALKTKLRSTDRGRGQDADAGMQRAPGSTGVRSSVLKSAAAAAECRVSDPATRASGAGRGFTKLTERPAAGSAMQDGRRWGGGDAGAGRGRWPNGVIA